MNYYKLNNEVFAYDDEQVAQGYASDKTPMTTEEAHAHLNPVPTPEQLEAQAKADAQAYLNSTDWYVVRMTETGTQIPDDVLTKRAEARSLL